MSRCRCIFEKIAEKQEELLEEMADAFDNVHEGLKASLRHLSVDNPTSAAACIGRCIGILEQSRDDANSIFDDKEDEDEDEDD